MAINGKARIELNRVAREAGTAAGKQFAMRPCAGGTDFFHTESDIQDAAIEACVDYGLDLDDETEDLCNVFTASFSMVAERILRAEGRFEESAAPTR